LSVGSEPTRKKNYYRRYRQTCIHLSSQMSTGVLVAIAIVLVLVVAYYVSRRLKGPIGIRALPVVEHATHMPVKVVNNVTSETGSIWLGCPIGKGISVERATLTTKPPSSACPDSDITAVVKSMADNHGTVTLPDVNGTSKLSNYLRGGSAQICPRRIRHCTFLTGASTGRPTAAKTTPSRCRRDAHFCVQSGTAGRLFGRRSENSCRETGRFRPNEASSASFGIRPGQGIRPGRGIAVGSTRDLGQLTDPGERGLHLGALRDVIAEQAEKARGALIGRLFAL
jgi:hypothetical protein